MVVLSIEITASDPDGISRPFSEYQIHIKSNLLLKGKENSYEHRIAKAFQGLMSAMIKKLDVKLEYTETLTRRAL